MSKITLIGFHNYMTSVDDDLWVHLTLPDGIDKEVLTNNILLRGGEFEVLYSNPYFLQSAIGIWSAKMQHTFNRWIKALNINYDPLNNYDRTEEWNIAESGNSSHESSFQESDANTSSENTSETKTGQSSSQASTDTEEKVSAYNSSTYQPDKTVNVDSTTSNTTSDTGSGTRSLQSSENTAGSEQSNDSHSDSTQRTGRAYGNIGVTTSQQMLEAELAVARWNLIDQITDLFLQEFVIPIY